MVSVTTIAALHLLKVWKKERVCLWVLCFLLFISAVLSTMSHANVNKAAWSSCTLTPFGRQFFFFSGCQKNDVHTLLLHLDLQHLYHNVIPYYRYQ